MAHDNSQIRRVGGVLVVVALAGVLWAEHRRPLRRQTQPKGERDARNFILAALSAATVAVVQKPFTEWLAQRAEQRCWGIRRLNLPGWVETCLAVALMDYTLYLWHVLLHRLPLLWRFHQVHHVDLDMDASTALRFHFGEMLLSVPWRAAQVAFIGVGRKSLMIWNHFLILCVLFHHSNLRLPWRLERALAWIIVTPRVHMIHHSIVEGETNSNWSAGLTLWDFVHGTLRLDIPEDRVTIGVPAFRNPQELTIGKLLAMPFRRQAESWRLPDGTIPTRQLASSAKVPYNTDASLAVAGDNG